MELTLKPIAHGQQKGDSSRPESSVIANQIKIVAIQKWGGN